MRHKPSTCIRSILTFSKFYLATFKPMKCAELFPIPSVALGNTLQSSLTLRLLSFYPPSTKLSLVVEHVFNLKTPFRSYLSGIKLAGGKATRRKEPS